MDKPKIQLGETINFDTYLRIQLVPMSVLSVAEKRGLRHDGGNLATSLPFCGPPSRKFGVFPNKKHKTMATTMKLRHRKSIDGRYFPEVEGESPPGGVGTDDSASSGMSAQDSPDRSVGRKDVSFSSTAAQFQQQQNGGFVGVDFSEEPFLELPETPVKEDPIKEPVWKKRLRYKGKAPVSQVRRATTAPPTPEPSPAPAPEDLPRPSPTQPKQHHTTEEESVVPREEEEEVMEKETGSRQPDLDSAIAGVLQKVEEEGDLAKPKPVTKTVSFDETGIQAKDKSRKKKKKHPSTRSRKRQESSRLDTTFEEDEEEASYDDLMRTDSSYSDIFMNLFEDDDFSLATPTIYTDATDGNSSISSQGSTGKSREREKYSWMEDDFDEFGPFGCKTSALMDEVRLFTDLFFPPDYICAKPSRSSDPPPPQRRKQKEKRGRSRKSSRRSRRSRSQG